jgi:hypothetical protein
MRFELGYLGLGDSRSDRVAMLEAGYITGCIKYRDFNITTMRSEVKDVNP